MPITAQGTLTCPCCAANIILSVTTNGTIIATVEFILRACKEGESPPGDVRPDGLPTGVHAKEGSSESAKAKFDRTTYQRKYMKPYMAKRRAEARKPKGSHQP